MNGFQLGRRELGLLVAITFIVGANVGFLVMGVANDAPRLTLVAGGGTTIVGARAIARQIRAAGRRG